MKYSVTFFAALTLCAASAAQSIRPGLWEGSSQMKGSAEIEMADAQMRSNLVSISDEGRKTVNAMLSASGARLGRLENGIRLINQCVSKELADDFNVQSFGSGSCSFKATRESANLVFLETRCQTPPSVGTGYLTLISPEEYKIVLKFAGDTQDGRDSVVIESWARWLAPSCGDLPPRSGTAPK